MKIKLLAIVLICVLLLSACQNDLKENNEMLNGDINKLENELTEKISQIDNLILTLDNIKKELDEANEKYDLTNEAFQKEMGEVNVKYNSTIETLQGKLELLEDEYLIKESDIKSLDNQIEEFENLIASYKKEIEDSEYLRRKQQLEADMSKQINEFAGYAQSPSKTKEAYCFLIEEDNTTYYSITLFDNDVSEVKECKVMLDSNANEFNNFHYKDDHTIILSYLGLKGGYPYYGVEVFDVLDDDVKQYHYFDYGYNTNEYEKYLQVENKENWLLNYSGTLYSKIADNMNEIKIEEDKVSFFTLSADQSKFAYVLYSEPIETESITIKGRNLDGSGEFIMKVPVYNTNVYSLEYVNNRYLYLITHVNPSASEINVIDTKELNIVTNAIGTRVTFGIDGQIIYQGDEGHYGPKESASKIVLENEVLYEADQVATTFISYALSADKKFIAILEEDIDQQFLVYGQIDYATSTIVNKSRILVSKVEGNLTIDEEYNIYARNEYKNYMHNKETSMWEQVILEKLDMSEYSDYIELKASIFNQLDIEHSIRFDLITVEFLLINK